MLPVSNHLYVADILDIALSDVSLQDFYFADGNVVFLVRMMGLTPLPFVDCALQVERVLYRIHRSILSRNSPFFRNLFSIPPLPDAKEVEGTSDDNPLHLPHILVDQFDAFLSTVYPR